MSSYGRQVLGTTGRIVQALANLDRVDWATGGITIDWATVTAAAADTTLDDGTIIKVGTKGIPFGTILCRQTLAEVQTITLSATGGTFTISGNGNTTAAIAYNATAATVQAAIRGLGGAYTDVLVTGNAGGPYTITYPTGTGDVAELTTTATSLTGGAGTAIVATTAAGTNAGTYGPYDSAATDGRQTLTRGMCFVLNETVLELDPAGGATNHPGVFDGGLVWKARLRLGGQNPAILGTGSEPSWAAFEAAFPRIRYAE